MTRTPFFRQLYEGLRLPDGFGWNCNAL
ncbi:hypothetical protein AB0K89_02220 [Streptomyces cinnamoneus]